MLIKLILLYPLDVVLGKFFKTLSVFNALEFLEAFFLQSSALNYWAALTLAGSTYDTASSGCDFSGSECSCWKPFKIHVT